MLANVQTIFMKHKRASKQKSLNYFSYENASNNTHVSHKDKAAELWSARKSLQSIFVLFQIDSTGYEWCLLITYTYQE